MQDGSLKQEMSEAGILEEVTDYADELFMKTTPCGSSTTKRAAPFPLPLEGAGGEVEYQYHQKDHLGNVRMTFNRQDHTLSAEGYARAIVSQRR